jgi:hypothetical protein
MVLYETYFYFYGNRKKIEDQVAENEEYIEDKLGSQVLQNITLFGDLLSIFVNCGIAYLIYVLYPTIIVGVAGAIYTIGKLLYLFVLKKNYEFVNYLMIGAKCIVAVMALVYILL